MSKKKSSKVASGQPGPELGLSVDEGKPKEEVTPQGTATAPTPELVKELTPTSQSPKKLTLSDVLHELENLKQTVLHHTEQLAGIETRVTKPRKSTSPASKTRIQIRDKETGIVYRSKNNTYKTMLKNGDLKELVDKGIFGNEPLKNSFGWFALKRAWPDRFEEIRETKVEDTADTLSASNKDGNPLQRGEKA